MTSQFKHFFSLLRFGFWTLFCASSFFGCVFTTDSNPDYKADNIAVLDSLKINGIPDQTFDLFLPRLSRTLAPGAAGVLQKEENNPLVKDYLTGKLLRYKFSSQDFGSWSAEREFQWNYFYLRTLFYFQSDLPDTTGMANDVKKLYAAIEMKDQFTRYFDSTSAGALKQRILTSDSKGFGIRMELVDTQDTLMIRQVVVISPAQKAGLKTGMRILAINDSSVIGDSAGSRFYRFVQGDGPFVFTVLLNQNLQTLVLSKATISFPSVMTDSLNGLGYIAVFSFTSKTLEGKSTASEFVDALLVTRNFPVTIIDLRDNGGGSVTEVIDMCQEVLSTGIIIRQLDRDFDSKAGVPVLSHHDYFANEGGHGENRKFVLLANGGSASASEIFVSALKENLHAPLVGHKTYGKGIGQSVVDTYAKGLALITTLHFYGGDGDDYHGKGIEPDYAVDSSGKAELNKAVSVGLLLAKTNIKVNAKQAANRTSSHEDLIELNRKEWLRKVNGPDAWLPYLPKR